MIQEPFVWHIRITVWCNGLCFGGKCLDNLIWSLALVYDIAC